MMHLLADGVIINPNIPAINNVATSGPAGWISNFYQFALIISGILAFGMIVYAGVQYAISAGNPHGQSEARSRITSSLLGLLLLGCAWLILYTINPNLVKLQVPTLTPITTANINAQAPCGNSYCPQGEQCTIQGTCVPFSNNFGKTTCSTIMCGSTCCAAGQTCNINILTSARSCG